MRTTIRLPDDLYTRVRVRAASEGETVTSFIEEALREALERHSATADVEPYAVRAFGGGGLRPGVDLDDTDALLEVMDGQTVPESRARR